MMLILRDKARNLGMEGEKKKDVVKKLHVSDHFSVSGEIML